ncbi:hypothetical protein [Luteitalea sp.]
MNAHITDLLSSEAYARAAHVAAHGISPSSPEGLPMDVLPVPATVVRVCRVCTQRPVVGRFAHHCDVCLSRIRRRKPRYPFTPERQQYLKTHYAPHEAGCVARIAAALNVPGWRVKRWAAELGLAVITPKSPDWTPTEVAFLEEHIGARTVGWIAKRLGRTATAVAVKSKRLAIDRRECRDWYTVTALALAMGVDSHVVTRWIRSGLLQAATVGQQREDGRPAMFSITVPAIRRFLQQHPTAYRLAKVDQVWFLGLVFGKVGAPRPEPSPEPTEARVA